jgi:hypothetical protein
MAVTTARDNEEFEKKPKLGASGGVAPEGYNMSMGHFAGEIKDDVLVHGKEASEKRFAEAKKYMDSLKKDEDSAKVQKEQEKEAAAKPTAPGGDVSKLEAGKGQSAKATEKEELGQLKAAEGDVKGAEAAKKAK